MAIIDDITNLYVGYFNRAPDPAGLNFWVAQRTAGASLAGIANSFAQSSEATGLYGFLAAPLVGSPTSFLASVYLNLFGRAIDAAGSAFWAGQLALPGAAVGQIIQNIISGAQGADQMVVANKAAVGKAFVTKLVDTNTAFNLALAKSAYNGVTSDVATVTTATAANDTAIASANVATASQVIRLTENVDVKTGGALNDTFDGTFATTVAGFASTFNSNDSLDGGAGTDTLLGQVLSAFIVPTSIKNIEIGEFQTSTIAVGTATLDLSAGDSAMTTIKFTNSGFAGNNLTVANIQSAPTNFVMSNIGAGLNFTASVAISKLLGTADAATIQLNNVAAVAGVPTSIVVLGNTGTSGYETLTIDSVGSVSNALAAFGDGISTSLANVKITGNQNLTLTLTDTTVTTVDASALVGSALAGKLTMTVAAGNTQNMTITGGSGSDIINMVGSYTNLDILDGGAGTDRLTVANAQAVGAVAAQTNVKNFEVLGLNTGSAGAITPGFFGATGLRFGANMAGATTVNYSTGTANTLDLVTFNDGGFALTVNVAGSATTDVLGVTIGSATPPAAGNAFGAGGVVINGAETINLASVGGANTFGGVFTVTDTAALQKITITGDQAITFTGVVTADEVNASGTTGTASLTLTAGTANASTIVGTANADILVGSAFNDIITGAAGLDTITGGSGADILTGGTEVDTFIFNGAAAATTSGITVGDTITDFALGADKIQFTGVTEVVSGQQAAVVTAVSALATGSTAAQIATAMATANTTNLGVSFATFAGDTYIYFETTGAGTGVAADDVFIKLAGVTTLPSFATDLIP
ncbi:MAG: DUF4214 domain-containing protein [Pseudomonadota bacterium]